MARRKVEVFSLSFLDVICCGFGAVILFYTIISAQSGIERTRKAEDLAAQVSKLEEEVLTGARNLVRLRNSLQMTESETVSASSRATQLIEELQRKRLDGVKAGRDAAAVDAVLARLAADAVDPEVNLMPTLVEASVARATLGEMVSALGSVFGWWDETPVI